MKNIFYLTALYYLLSALPLSAQTLFEDATADIGQELFVAGSIALQDADNDNWPDLFLAHEANDGSNPVALLRNNADGSFADRAAQIAAVEQIKWKGEGNAWADYDNDGDLDLFQPRGQVRNYEPDLLLRNDQGTFSDVSAAAGFNTALPSNIAVWLDYDRDGHVDLYVGHFIIGADPDLTNALYRNQGDGTFTEVTQSAGLAIPLHPEGLPFAGGSPLGMAAADFDDDGWPDLYITAIFAPNRLFINQRDGTFAEAPEGDLNDPGEAFGMAIGDIDNDGDLDIFQPSGVGEQRFRSPLLLNQGDGVFLDITESAGLESLTDQNTRGGVLFDVDNDGDLDLLIPFPLSFFLNNGNGTFTEATEISGLVSIGGQTAIGDYDRDGFLDIATGGNSPNEIPTNLHRNLGNDNHYLRVALVGTVSNRSAIGARLTATAGDLVQTQQILGSLGTSQYELVAHFGLGANNQVDQLQIRWPNGLLETFADIPADQEIRIVEGGGEWHPIEVLRNAETAVLEEFTEGTPDDFALDQNFPNPFNSGTVIRFQLPQSEEVELAIYNLAGQQVVTLIQGTRPAGIYSINWDGKDEQGARLATGIYLYQLRNGERVETRKLTLLR